MIDLDSSYRWLQWREFPFPFTLGLIVGQMHQAAQLSRRSVTNDYALEAIQFVDRLQVPLERSVVRLECAIAYSRVNLPQHASGLIREGVEILLPYVDQAKNNKHYYAVANWLLGCVLVETPHHRVEVIHRWNISMETFGSLVNYPHNLTGEKDWYRIRYHEMGNEIRKLIMKEPITPSQDANEPILLPEEWPTAELHPGGHQVLEVVGEIPAGGFSPAGIDSHATERIHLKPEMKIFRLSGADHSMYNLRAPDRVVRLNPSGRYFLLQVTGDSMNLAQIDKDDYVLIRQQSAAENGQIVAVGVVEEDVNSNLKRYYERNGVIILQPESSDGKWKPHEYTMEDQFSGRSVRKFLIHGVALAVFKPSRKPGP